MSTSSFNELLNKYGLLSKSITFSELPKNIKDSFTEHHQTQFQHGYLTIIANAGPTFWSTLKEQQHALNEAHPVDEHSLRIAKELASVLEHQDDVDILYPGTGPAPLMALGKLVGWSHPSPLGLGIHSHFGLWFAYRALIFTKQALQPPFPASEWVTSDSNNSPCLTCVDTPCVSACPAFAVSLQESFDIGACAKHRMDENSECAQQCHARNACPVGMEFQYSEEQRAHHMTRALQAMVKWAEKP